VAVLRPATEADVAAITHLVDAAYRPYVERIGMRPGPMGEDYREVVRNLQVTVAESEGALVGVLVLGTTPDGFLIHNVAVHPAHRGKGLGRALLELAESEARKAGFDSIYLFTHEGVLESRVLYERIGYVEYERRPLEGFSLVFMRKALAS
jgi:N-acetylglutamate synthase-like GNAT family acetyltransferase